MGLRDTPEGKLMLRMLMILAEYERELTVSRINDGGAKDKGRRRKSGYVNRWLKK